MAEKVPTSRWYLYRLRYLFIFAVFVAINVIATTPAGTRRVLIGLSTAFVSSLAVSTIFYLSERYKEGLERIWIWVALALIIVLAAAILWHIVHMGR